MVWENRVEIIAMVTNEVEGGVLKVCNEFSSHASTAVTALVVNRAQCDRYWPEKPGDKLKFGGITVKFMDVVTQPGFVVRKLALKNSKVGVDGRHF